ncbi:MAG: PilZ domain-containing protein [Myxococcota bacterium]|nr:PilZ domain-containing protein [Myxococcota bacterium]
MGGSEPENLDQEIEEFMYLDRKRSSSGLSPTELRRWISLKRVMSKRASGSAPDGTERRESVRVPTHLSVSFGNASALGESLMMNLSRGGVFLATDQSCEIGTTLELRIHLEDTDDEIVVSAKVVSLNMRPDVPGPQRGMGLAFLDMPLGVRDRIETLYEQKLKEAAASERD